TRPHPPSPPPPPPHPHPEHPPPPPATTTTTSAPSVSPQHLLVNGLHSFPPSAASAGGVRDALLPGLPCGVTDEVNRGGPRAFHRQLLQSVQRSAHLRIPEGGPLRESETCQQSAAVLHATSCGWRLPGQEAQNRQQASPSPVKSSPETSPMTSPRQRRDSDRYCQLCNAWFNNPGMAQQHYDGKKHKKNAARADLLEQLGKTLDMGEMKGLKRSYTCEVCSVTLNSVAQYHAHLQGSKHQNNLKNQICVQ
uniref:Zinc finger matrin-type 4 n=1 Tax=Gasterosteus aculeatus aculeatus TaxID=481459 RepID=A0AAQ4NZN1_GASAC